MSPAFDPDLAKLAAEAAKDPSFQEAAGKAAQAASSGGNEKLWSDVLRFAPLGAAAMLARILLSQEPVTFGWIVRRMSAAGITACLVGFVSQDYIHTEGLRYAAVGMSGYAAPEVLDYALRYLKAKGDAQMKAVGAKPKGKRKKK